MKACWLKLRVLVFVFLRLLAGVSSPESFSGPEDAQKRHMKDPSNPENYIPAIVQTWTAPVSYALHPVLAPPKRLGLETAKGVPMVTWGVSSQQHAACPACCRRLVFLVPFSRFEKLQGQPLTLNPRDRTLELISDPQAPERLRIQPCRN